VRDFYGKFIQRGRITVGIAGGYTPEFRSVMLAPLVQIGFQKKRPLDVPAAPVPTKRAATIIQKEAPAVAVSFGAPLTIKRGDPDWLALWLVRSWLGEHRNSSAHLYNRIREARGMNYGDYAYIEYFPYGMYMMQPQPNYARRHDLFQIWLRPLRDNNDAVFATRAALYEIDKLVKNGLTAEQFESSRAFLSKFVTNLTATQTRQLGYAFDSSYYGTPEFKQYVRDGLAALTLDKVNAAIRAHIKPEQFQFVFVAKDAAGLAKALSSGAPSPIKYNSDKPADLLAEDKVIQKYPLKLAPKDVRVVQDTTLFE
jgi:zinc protease